MIVDDSEPTVSCRSTYLQNNRWWSLQGEESCHFGDLPPVKAIQYLLANSIGKSSYSDNYHTDIQTRDHKICSDPGAQNTFWAFIKTLFVDFYVPYYT